ncbi:MAG TPA: hypothetical protein VF676_05900 [Flavobacterium sp.]|jgi:hypothetical protein
MLLQNKLQNVIQANSDACTRVVAKKVAQTYVHIYDCLLFMRLFM